MSVRDPRTSALTSNAGLAEREAVRLLVGVGGDLEWWIYSTGKVGHLRVPLTAEEYQQIPPGCALADAGDTGPQRPRTRK